MVDGEKIENKVAIPLQATPQLYGPQGERSMLDKSINWIEDFCLDSLETENGQAALMSEMEGCMTHHS